MSIKDKIKQQRNSTNGFVRFCVERLYNIAQILYIIKGLLTDPSYRSVCYMKLFRKDQVQQTTQETHMNRYPDVFRGCAEYWKKKKDLKILSFGCCTGEEVVTLRQYFPDAEIVGAELNKHSLEVCRKRNLDDKIKFIESTHENILEQGPFDLVFCMAVLMRTPSTVYEKKITSLKKIYPFEKFEKQVVELDEYVKDEGMLVICLSQYDLMDTKVASKYTIVDDFNYAFMLFDKNSELVKTVGRRNSVFVKKKDEALDKHKN